MFFIQEIKKSEQRGPQVSTDRVNPFQPELTGTGSGGAGEGVREEG